MSTSFLVHDGTPIRWAASGGDKALTLTSLANNAGRAGQKADLGANRAELFGFRLKTRLASAPVAGEQVRAFLAFSEDDTNFAGAVTGSDAAYSDEDQLAHLVELRPLAVDGDTDPQQVCGIVRALARHVAPVVFNDCGQALTATAGDHELSLWPIEGVSP